MIVTTTPSIEGQHIESYLGPISAHVVFGVNIFSDIAASWRDVFGGRSQTYQKQLHRLTAAALIDLDLRFLQTPTQSIQRLFLYQNWSCSDVELALPRLLFQASTWSVHRFFSSRCRKPMR